MIKIVTYQLEPALLPSIPICSKKNGFSLSTFYGNKSRKYFHFIQIFYK